ncbi:unnamed protein product [Heterotrigona itama]|uniref:Uncharacterized protein n=1 Tax=Heterotrigona itama TaxID=395501 RepID=A0A6V7HEH0_9HYME|nr:unnamed protein product [Heterotrigona itama]
MSDRGGSVKIINDELLPSPSWSTKTTSESCALRVLCKAITPIKSTMRKSLSRPRRESDELIDFHRNTESPELIKSIDEAIACVWTPVEALTIVSHSSGDSMDINIDEAFEIGRWLFL